MSEQAHRVRIEAWDGDLAIHLPQGLVDALELEEGDDVDLNPSRTPHLQDREAQQRADGPRANPLRPINVRP